MQIVIDIDDESYEHIKSYKNEDVLPMGWYAISHGTPLTEVLERNAKDLAERICQQIDEEAVYNHVSGKWYYEKVFHYIQTINNLKERLESEDKE